jgi:hypothetical protein
VEALDRRSGEDGMTTRSWESVRLEQKNAKVEQLAQVAMRGIKEDAMNGSGGDRKDQGVEDLNQMAKIGTGVTLALMAGTVVALSLGLVAIKHTVLGIRRGWSGDDEKGSMAKNTGTIELQDGNYIVRIFLKGDDYIVLEGYYIDRALIWNQHRWKFTRQSAAIKFAEKSLKLRSFTQPYMVSAAFRKAHLVE